MGHFNNYLGLGIAGNFALHLEQAGEIEDFKDLEVEDENGPKGMFPFYLPGREGQLGVYPISSDTIKLPDGDVNVQAEPEVALICDITYVEGKVASITPTHFAAYNDCSIRKEGAKKISEKKNWGEASKGISDELIPIDRFEAGGEMDSWHIASFLKRDGAVFRYGEDVELTGYSYFYGKLTEWILNQMNTQVDVGPLEPLNEYIEAAGYPEKAIISIGATRYTPYGETTFLKSGDEVIVVLYRNGDECDCKNKVLSKIASGTLSCENGTSILTQRVV